ncbi:MAG: glycosyltransferase family 2 protein [Candidatus Binataceae bacterium]
MASPQLKPSQDRATEPDGNSDLDEAVRKPDGKFQPVTTNPRLPGITVFLPAHNEEANIERVANGFCAELPKLADSYEVVVVDDGSRDNTGEIADRMAAANPRVKVIHHGVNRGYGAAVISGIRAASEPYVLLADGDGQFDPADVVVLVARMPGYDAVIGRRVRRADHLMRRINGKAWTMLARMLFGLKVSDMDCGFKLFRREILDGIELHANGALISTELLARLAGRGAKICEVDVNHLPRVAGEQTGNSPQVIIRAFSELFSLYRELKQARDSATADAKAPR